jgi:hypothetical protein
MVLREAVPSALVLSEPTFPFRTKSRYHTMGNSAILSKSGVWAKGRKKQSKRKCTISGHKTDPICISRTQHLSTAQRTHRKPRRQATKEKRSESSPILCGRLSYAETQRVNIISRGLVVTLYLGLRRFIFHSGYLLVGIWEVYGGTNRLPLAEGDALKYVSMTVAVSYAETQRVNVISRGLVVSERNL